MQERDFDRRVMKLPRIYDHFIPGQLVVIDEMKAALEISGNSLRKRLSELSTRGYIEPVRQGLYLVCPASPSREPLPVSAAEVASKLNSQSYLGYRSALQYHLNEDVPTGRPVCVVSPTKFNPFFFRKHEFLWISSSDQMDVLTFVDPFRSPNCIRLTSIEKSFVDCLCRPHQSPSFSELLRAFAGLRHRLDYDRLLQHAQRVERAALFNRMGFLLDCVSHLVPVPMEVIDRALDLMSRKLIDWNMPVMGAEGEVKESSVLSGGLDARTFRDLGLRWRVQFTGRDVKRFEVGALP